MWLFTKNINIDRSSKKLDLKMIALFEVIGEKKHFTKIASLSSYKNQQCFSSKSPSKHFNKFINR